MNSTELLLQGVLFLQVTDADMQMPDSIKAGIQSLSSGATGLVGGAPEWLIALLVAGPWVLRSWSDAIAHIWQTWAPPGRVARPPPPTQLPARPPENDQAGEDDERRAA